MLDRLRVLLAIGSLGGGGAERQVLEILRHLDRQRFAPSLYLLHKSGELLPEVPDDVPVFAFWERHAGRRLLPGVIRWMVWRDLARVLREERIDLLYDRTYLMTRLTAGAMRFHRVPRIAACVADPECELKLHHRRFRGWAYQRARRAYLEADCVVANSEGLRRRMIDYFRLPENKVELVRNLVDFERIDRLAAEPAPNLDPKQFHIVIVGRVDAMKGYRYLLEAVRILVREQHHDRLRLHVVGRGPLEGELREFTGRHGLAEQVRFWGYLANPFPLVRIADLFCFPSLHEGSPNALIEAVACGVPVLAADCPSGPREILGDGRFGQLVPPGDVPALVAAIDDCFHHPAAWRGRTADARRHVEQMFSIREGIARLERLFERMAGRGEFDAETC